MFLPSGTMCNQIALLVHRRPGDQVIAADLAHIFTSEAGAGAPASRACKPWPLVTTKRESFLLRRHDGGACAARRSGRHSPRSRCSLARADRSIVVAAPYGWPLAAIVADRARGPRRHGLSVHMDGARLHAAQVASGVSAKQMAAACDSTSGLTSSKGLPAVGRRGARRLTQLYRGGLGPGSTGMGRRRCTSSQRVGSGRTLCPRVLTTSSG